MAAALLVTLALACAPSPAPSTGGSPAPIASRDTPADRPSAAQPRKGLYQDLAYADGERLLDLYLPQRGGPAPVAVWLHGGSWVTGDKRPVPAVLLGLRDRGFAVAAVNYRLTGVSSHPAQLHDVKGAVRWLRAHADEYGLDPARVYLVGFSAGGHLASLAGLTGGDAALEGDVGGNLDRSSAVDGVVVYAGPSDLPRLAGDCAGCQGSAQFVALGCSFLLCGDSGAAASPLMYAKAGAPPFLILHGDADRVVPVEQARLLDAALRQSGVRSRLVVVEGGQHGLLGGSTDAATQEFLLGLAGIRR